MNSEFCVILSKSFKFFGILMISMFPQSWKFNEKFLRSSTDTLLLE